MCLVSHIARDLVTNVDDGPRGFFEFVMPPVDIVEDGAEFDSTELTYRVLKKMI